MQLLGAEIEADPIAPPRPLSDDAATPTAPSTTIPVAAAAPPPDSDDDDDEPWPVGNRFDPAIHLGVVAGIVALLAAVALLACCRCRAPPASLASTPEVSPDSSKKPGAMEAVEAVVPLPPRQEGRQAPRPWVPATGPPPGRTQSWRLMLEPDAQSNSDGHGSRSDRMGSRHTSDGSGVEHVSSVPLFGNVPRGDAYGSRHRQVLPPAKARNTWRAAAAASPQELAPAATHTASPVSGQSAAQQLPPPPPPRPEKGRRWTNYSQAASQLLTRTASTASPDKVGESACGTATSPHDGAASPPHDGATALPRGGAAAPLRDGAAAAPPRDGAAAALQRHGTIVSPREGAAAVLSAGDGAAVSDSSFDLDLPTPPLTVASMVSQLQSTALHSPHGTTLSPGFSQEQLRTADFAGTRVGAADVVLLSPLVSPHRTVAAQAQMYTPRTGPQSGASATDAVPWPVFTDDNPRARLRPVRTRVTPKRSHSPSRSLSMPANTDQLTSLLPSADDGDSGAPVATGAELAAALAVMQAAGEPLLGQFALLAEAPVEAAHGSVQLGTEAATGKPVAIKVLPPLFRALVFRPLEVCAHPSGGACVARPFRHSAAAVPCLQCQLGAAPAFVSLDRFARMLASVREPDDSMPRLLRTEGPAAACSSSTRGPALRPRAPSTATTRSPRSCRGAWRSMRPPPRRHSPSATAPRRARHSSCVPAVSRWPPRRRG